MSDIDPKPTPAERRLSSQTRRALANAKSSGRLDRLVQATVAAAVAIPAPPETPVAREPREPKALTARTWPAGIGAAAIATAVALTWVTTHEDVADPVPTSTPAAVTQPAPSEQPPSSPEAPASAPGVAVTSLPDVPSAKPSAAAPAPSSTGAALTGRSTAVDVGTKVPDSEQEIRETPSELFERANKARRGGDDATAQALYHRLVDAHPSSREAITSRVILGRMELARGAPAAALASFDAYLASERRGSLHEEALVGRARSLQTLGRRAEERAAWRTLLEQFPETASRSVALERSAD